MELPTQALSECSASTPTAVASMRQLADVVEEPVLLDEQVAALTETYGTYGLYRHLPGRYHSRRDSFEAPDWIPEEYDFDYDAGFLSESDYTPISVHSRKKRNAAESALSDFTSKLGSRMPTIRAWRSAKRAPLRASPTTCLSLENVLSHVPQSGRSSLVSASNHRLSEVSSGTAAMSSNPSMSFYSLDDEEDDDADSGLGLGIEISPGDQSHLERDRAMSTTPLLPPLITSGVNLPPRESPLQSPKVDFSPTPDAPQSPSTAASPHFACTPLSTRPSNSSLRKISSNSELPPTFGAILQEQDAWSDRLGHANFTISPQPHELESLEPEAVAKYRSDWDLARSNYTKHLVRIGENYGQTSKIYALTEAKWASIEREWRTTIEDLVRNSYRSAPGSAAASRNHSRGRGRGRSSSTNTAAPARLGTQDDLCAELEWTRMEDCMPSAVPQMLESLNADGKFPGRGDEDIIGPMQRDAVMAHAPSEDAKGRFWKIFADKVGLRK